jgi:hypothetical protein
VLEQGPATVVGVGTTGTEAAGVVAAGSSAAGIGATGSIAANIITTPTRNWLAGVGAGILVASLSGNQKALAIEMTLIYQQIQ